MVSCGYFHRKRDWSGCFCKNALLNLDRPFLTGYKDLMVLDCINLANKALSLSTFSLQILVLVIISLGDFLSWLSS